MSASNTRALQRRARWICLSLTLALTGCAMLGHAQEKDASQGASQADADGASARPEQRRRQRNQDPVFDIRVESADADVRELIEKFNDLQRYRTIGDLGPVEMERLMALESTDVRKLVATQGYFAPKIEVAREEPPADTPGALPVVVIRVDPGPPTDVSAVDLQFSGDIATSHEDGAQRQKEAIIDGWSLKKGERFTQAEWSDAKTNVLRHLVEARYPLGKLEASRADIDAASSSARLSATWDSGPAFRLGEPEVKGAALYPPELAPRLSWLKPGAVYEQKKLIDAQGRLATSGYYDSAYISLDTEGDPSAAPLRYLVKEAKPKKLQLGLGYSTDSGPRVSIEHRNNKFFGSNWRSDAKLELDPKTPLVQFGLTSLPNAHGWKRGALARYMLQDDGTLTTLSRTVRVGLAKTTERYDRDFFLQYDAATVTGSGGQPVPDALLGDGSALSVNYNWTGRYFDNMLSPTRGYGLGADVGLGITAVGRHLPFSRVRARWLGLVPITKTLGQLSLRTELGAVLSSSTARIPATYLFRTGGDTTVRGYGFRSIGVPVGQGLVAPGRYMAVASAEWLRPILQERMPGLLQHVVFIDYGSIARRANQLRPHWGVGTGVRVNSPVGPMEVDIAYGLQSRQLRLHLNVGFTF